VDPSSGPMEFQWKTKKKEDLDGDGNVHAVPYEGIPMWLLLGLQEKTCWTLFIGVGNHYNIRQETDRGADRKCVTRAAFPEDMAAVGGKDNENLCGFLGRQEWQC
jgi:hypothetical protein